MEKKVRKTISTLIVTTLTAAVLTACSPEAYYKERTKGIENIEEFETEASKMIM